MRMDLVKSQYANFDKIYLYCYNVTKTVGLMSVSVMGIALECKDITQNIYNAALELGINLQISYAMFEKSKSYSLVYVDEQYTLLVI